MTKYNGMYPFCEAVDSYTYSISENKAFNLRCRYELGTAGLNSFEGSEGQRCKVGKRV